LQAQLARVVSELSAVRSSQATNALRLLDLQGAYVLLEEKIAANKEQLQEANKQLEIKEQQLLDLRAGRAVALQRAELAERSHREAAMALAEVVEAEAAAAAAKKVAVEAAAAAEAKAKLATGRLAGKQGK
jgi:hypothetical protein